jgi:hypothetical protein
VLGDNEGVEPTLLHRRAQPSWSDALVGDESCDTKLHAAQPFTPSSTSRVIGSSTQAAGLRGSQARAFALNVLAHDIAK